MPKRFLLIGGILSFAFLALSVFVGILWLRIIFICLTCFCFFFFVLACCAYRAFSPRGKNLQNQIYDALLDNFSWNGNGNCLEIGCGNAPISIKIAKKFPQSKVIASDYWGETYFEYDQEQAQINAKLENVLDQLEFKNINAAHLPFQEGELDAIISNLTFHEVKGFKMKEKYKGLIEALRVLKKGGIFAFQDLFGSKSIYGDFEKMRAILEEHVAELHWVDTFAFLKLPKWLDNVIMLKGLGILYGTK
ncbi:MAG: class I SAM-dependent methyltransferase [Candidatus Lokiarchaeota archaeon]|nr:class I SAM-dependent methyltransferase [Candidatus Lokiarchaeota archaeon]